MDSSDWKYTYTEMAEWLLFAEQYINTAQLGCREILEPKHERQRIFSDYFLVNKGTHPIDEVQMFYFPIVYNFKHGLELALKYFQLRLHVKPDHVHDIDYLFSEFKKILNTPKARKLLDDMAKNDPEIFGNEFFDRENLDREMADLQDIVGRYHRIDYICSDAIQIMEDYKNDAFRYPSNNLRVKIDYVKHLKSVTVEDVRKLRDDIGKAISAITMLMFMIQP